MLSLSNVRPGWKGIVVDDIGGLLVAAVLIRMGGRGTIFVINNADSPPDLHLLELFNLPEEMLAPMKSLNWAQTEADWTTDEIEELLSLHQEDILPSPALLKPTIPSDSTPLDHLPPSPPTPDRPKKKEPNNKSKSKKKFQRVQELMAIRQEFLSTEFEGLITCSEYEPESIVTKLLDKLSGSSTIVIYSSHLRPLSDLQTLLKKCSLPAANPSSSVVVADSQNQLSRMMRETKTEFIQITISEPWLRAYQVLVGRTHPEMSGTHHGGFIFSAIKVISSCS